MTDRASIHWSLWVRWSLRDLRRRWVQVAAIALVAGLGSGAYVGLSSSSTWRRLSYDASFEALKVHDLEVTFSTGTAAPAGDLLAAASATAHPKWIEAVTPRLVVPTQVDASFGGHTILVPGRLVGIDLRGGGPPVDQLDTRAGRAIAENDVGASDPVVALDYHFAQHHEMPPQGSLKVSGGRPVRYVGQVLSPQYFMVMNEQGSFLAEAGYAVVFAPIGTVQDLAGKPGQANELGVRVAPGADVGLVATELRQSLAARIPSAAVVVTPLTEERAYRLLYDDIDGDQRFYSVFAVLILAGAAFAAFNLASRIVESQRREIGVGMALGVPSPWLAVRPLLVGFEVAALGVGFGVVVGLAIGQLMAGVMSTFFPMPRWITPFQAGTFAWGALIGIALVFSATIYPVVRAVRVAPIDAIKVGLRETKPSGWAGLVQRLPLPGNSLAQMPLRNALRNPRRSLLTALGIAAAIATLIGVIGTLDSFYATLDRGEREILSRSPDRLLVGIDGFQVAGSKLTETVKSTPGVGQVEEGLRVVGEASGNGRHFDTIIDLIDFDSPVWAPSIIEGARPGNDGPSGVVISQKAADDLGARPGGTIHLRHPYREGFGYRWVEEDVPVSGIHPNPYRFMVYMDRRGASTMNLEGIINAYEVLPAAGADIDAIVRSLFDQPGIASVERVRAVTETIRSTISRVTDVLDIVEGVVLLLAVLIAFNSSSISADERAREHATMFAYGVPTRTVLIMGMAESAVVGIIATLIGVAFGRALLAWIIRVMIPETMPDIYVRVSVSPSTYLMAGVLGVVAVSLAPVLTVRKLRRMPIPETLRVVE